MVDTTDRPISGDPTRSIGCEPSRSAVTSLFRGPFSRDLSAVAVTAPGNAGLLPDARRTHPA